MDTAALAAGDKIIDALNALSALSESDSRDIAFLAETRGDTYASLCTAFATVVETLMGYPSGNKAVGNAAWDLIEAIRWGTEPTRTAIERLTAGGVS